MVHRRTATLALALTLAAQGRACYNDRDTEIRERASPPEVLRALTGSFVRYPASYYEVRAARLNAKPTLTDPELDDLAVALGRLGREEEGLKALARKKGATRESRYRLRANRGTLLAHLALRRGGHRGGDKAQTRRALRARGGSAGGSKMGAGLDGAGDARYAPRGLRREIERGHS